MRHLRTIPFYVVGALLALYGVLALVGAGGDNDQRASYAELGGHRVSTYAVAAVSLVLAAAALAFARRRSN
jgi:drug/metabolite transporter (DMT)-like permease